MDQSDQLRLGKAANRSDGFEADAVGFEDLVELGDDPVVLLPIALYESFRTGLGNCHSQNCCDLSNPVVRESPPESRCKARCGRARLPVPGWFPRDEDQQTD